MTYIYMNLQSEASEQEISTFNAIIDELYDFIQRGSLYKTELKKLNTHRCSIKFERSILNDPDARNRIAYFKDHGYTMKEVMAAFKEFYGEEPETP